MSEKRESIRYMIDEYTSNLFHEIHCNISKNAMTDVYMLLIESMYWQTYFDSILKEIRDGVVHCLRTKVFYK